MHITRYSFREHTTRRQGHFKCACGKRYSRVRRESWTENPFHAWQGRELELTRACQDRADNALKGVACPKCNRPNNPIKIV